MKRSENNKNQQTMSKNIIICSSCSKEIKTEDEKHCFWDEDIEDGVKLTCLNCHLDSESTVRDFGF